jgi:hypothetical protein
VVGWKSYTSVFWTKNIELSAVFYPFSITTATTAILVMDKVHETHSGSHNRPYVTVFALHASFEKMRETDLQGHIKAPRWLH